MALVNDSFVPTITRTVFLKPRDMVRELTPIPRALLNFSVAAAAVTLKAMNDTYRADVSIVLPFQFAYRLMELTQTINQDIANDYASVPFLAVLNGIRRIPQGTTVRFPWNLVDTFQVGAADPPVEANMIRPMDGSVRPTGILQSIVPRVSPTINFHTFNINTAAAAAGTLDFFASFLEYDLEQVERYPVHYPILTYDR